MKRKNLFTSAVIITALSLSVSAFVSGCGKQEEIVNAAMIEEVTPTSEEESSTVETEESSSIATEESSTVDTEESSTDNNADSDNLGIDGEFSDGEYNELDEANTDETVDISVDTDDSKIVIIDGVEYLDIGGDDLTEDEIKDMLGDTYVPPTGDTSSTQNPTTVIITNPDGTTQTAKPGSGDDAQGPEFPDIYVPDGTSIQ